MVYSPTQGVGDTWLAVCESRLRREASRARGDHNLTYWPDAIHDDSPFTGDSIRSPTGLAFCIEECLRAMPADSALIASDFATTQQPEKHSVCIDNIDENHKKFGIKSVLGASRYAASSSSVPLQFI